MWLCIWRMNGTLLFPYVFLFSYNRSSNESNSNMYRWQGYTGMQRTRVNSRRKARKSSVDKEAVGVHQSVRFSISLIHSPTKYWLKKKYHNRRWVQRGSSRRMKRRRKERRRNGKRKPRKIRIVRKTVTKRRSLREEVGRRDDASLHHKRHT